MKNLKIILIVIGCFISNLSQSQTAVAQTSAQPTAAGHLIDPTTNCVLRYYYFPNLEAYYDTQKNVYYYTQDGKWLTANEIPSGYRGYSMYNKVNIIIKDYDDEDPTQFVSVHRKKYPYITRGGLKKMTASID